ncbi:response regulator [Azospirillum sp. sgz302134]
MHAKGVGAVDVREGAGQDATAPRRGWRARVGALALAAALAGGLAGGSSWVATAAVDALLRNRVERALNETLELMRVADAASALSSAVTQLENAPTAPHRQAIHPALNRYAQQLGDGLEALIRSASEPDGIGPTGEHLAVLRGSIAAMRAGVEELNETVDRRLALERDLRALLERIPARSGALAAALSSLPAGEARSAIEAHGRSLAAQLLAAGLSPTPSAGAAADFRKGADALLAALDALPIDPFSPRRVEAARQLAALGTDSGNLFALRLEQARLAAGASSAASALRERADEIAAEAERGARDRRDAVLADRDRALTRLAAGPALLGLLSGLTVFAVGGCLLRLVRRHPDTTPQEKPPMTMDAPDEPSEEAGVEDGVPPLHILLAEDEPVNQMAATALLRRAGHTVTLAGDGRAALEAVEKERYDLVLMDLRMPEMDGIEATRRIRALSGRSAMRIVMLTASAVPGDPERCLEAGADAVVEKPLRLDTLQPVLERLYAIAPSPAASVSADASEVFDEGAIRQMREHLPAERVATLIGGTVTTLRQYHATLAEAWEAGDMATVSAMAHKIAGVSGLYGCTALRRAAQALERAVETGDGDPAGLREALDATFVPALEALEGQLAGV